MKRLAIILILGIIINVVVIDRLHTLLNIRYDSGALPLKIERRQTEESRDADTDRLSVMLLSGFLTVADGALIVWIYKLRTRPKPTPKL